MADGEQVAKLRQGVAAWNTWRRDNPTIRPDLSGITLEGTDFSGVNLSGANLGGANLNRIYFIRASLSGANLSGASLIDATLVDANLSGANLSGAKLPEATLIRATSSMSCVGNQLNSAPPTGTSKRDGLRATIPLPRSGYLNGLGVE
jgi:uncharacterized protein YjbI with pentapeptide repeats